MTKFNFQSISFAIVVLLLILMGKSEGELEGNKAEANAILETSLTAQIKSESVRSFPAEENKSAENQNPAKELKGRILTSVKPEFMPPATDAPKINARTALVKEIGGSEPLWSKNPGVRWPLASITKLMTALIVMEKLNPEATVTLSEKAIAEEGSAGGFSAGEVFSVQDLLQAALASSSNDAAFALAEFYGYEEFLRQMRTQAFELGMADTVFKDPTGLSILNQSNIDDIEKLTNFILNKYPRIFEITAQPSLLITEINSGAKRKIFSNNKFAGQAEFLGGKTGYTDEANGNLISLFNYKGRQFLIVVFGTDDRFHETERLYNWLKINL